MIKNLFFTTKLALLLVFSFLSLNFAAQTTMLEYRFGGNLDPTVAGPATTSLTYTSGTPAYSGGWLRIAQSKPNDYLELTTNTSGKQNMSLSFDGRLSALGLDASWIVETNYGSGTTFTELTRINFFSLVWIPFNRSLNYTLPATCENKTELKIRIRPLFDGSVAGNLDIDNLKITYGNPKIHISTNGNTTVTPNIPANSEVPHLAAPSVILDTDFGVKSPDMADITHRFRVRNLNGSSGSKLRIDSIVIEGANPGDFAVSPISLSDINQTTSATSSTYKTFDITFNPLEDGLRTAQVYLYSNAYGTGSNNPYIINVLGVGASCKLLPSDFAINKMEAGQQTLTADYNPSTDLIGGVAYTTGSNYNTINTRLYPDGNLYTSSSTSWYVRSAPKIVEFGPLNISDQKNVAISFKVGAFTTSNEDPRRPWSEWDYEENGLDHNSTIKVSVLKEDNATWSQEMTLRGAVIGQGPFRYQQYFRYAFDGNGTFTSTYSGNNPNNTQSNSSSTKYSTIVLNIPATANISNLKFKIEAQTNSNARLWLIDDVKVITSNAVYKTFTTGNVWSPSAPTANEKAIIEGNYTNAGNQTICECEVKDGGTLTIPANTSVTVRGKITNHGDGNNFVVQTGGNLIQIEDEAVNSGSITAERYVTDMDNVLGTQLDYVYWSSPVTGQDLRAFSPGTRTNKIFYYNEPTDLFKAVNFATEPNFVPGKGYAFEAETTGNGTHSPNATGYNETYKFKGTPNNGVIRPDVQRSANTGSGATVEHGYNLIGNPYPSNISFPEFYAMNSTKIYNTAWFWTNNLYTQYQQGSNYTPNNYAVWTGTGGAPATSISAASGSGDTFKPDGIVAVGQGFIVQVRPEHIGAGTQQLIFKNKNTSNGNMVRVSTAGHFFNKNAEQKDRFWLKLISSDSIVNTQLIGYIEGATNDFEKDYDAEIMGMSSNIFYSTLEDRKLQIQGKAAFDPSDKVQLGANIFKNGNYTIAIENPEGIFNAGQKVYLKDNLLNRWVDLNAQAYTFEATKGITEGRFEIVYESPTVLATDAVTKDELMVYRDSGDFVVKAKSKKITSLEVYDGSGRLVYTTRPNDTKVVITGDRLNRGVYILKINQDGVVTAKKILK